MRMLLVIELPVEEANDAIKDGTLAGTIQSILEEQKPEAAYFGEVNGCRTGFIVVDCPDASDIPRLAEPWFLSFNAAVEFHPVMTPGDLANAGPFIAEAVEKYG